MEVVVIGAGVVGLASAYELATAGAQVTVLDAGAAGAGASHGNAAKIAIAESAPVAAPGVLLQGIRWMLRRDSPLAVAPRLAPDHVRFMLAMARHCNAADFQAGLRLLLGMAADANDLLDDYQRRGVGFEMHERGVLLAFETQQRFEEHSASLGIYEEFGMVPERLHGPDEVQQAEPALTDHIRYGLRFVKDRQVEPDTLTRSLVVALRDQGAVVREGVGVASFVTRGDRVRRVVAASGQEFPADAVVLAAGVANAALAAALGVRLPICSGKGYSIDYTPSPVQLRTSLTLEDARVAVTPLNGYTRLAGTMEFGRPDDRVDPLRVEAIRRAARASFRGWSEAAPPTEGAPWAGHRPMTPDGLPVVGAFSSVPNAYVAGGHGMLGLTLAPATGRMIAALVAGDPSRLDGETLRAVSPDRFTRRGGRLRRTLRAPELPGPGRRRVPPPETRLQTSRATSPYNTSRSTQGGTR